jgi:Holliday junction resolvasome RuvABC DNA-binding subunit
LKDKVGKHSGDKSALTHDHDALLALKSLGYTQEEVRGALKRLPKDILGTQERIKEALKLLSR